MRAAHIKTNGLITATDFSGLDDMQQAVGGLLEMTGGNGWFAYVNEEGLIHKLPHNPTASHILGQHIVGNVILFGGMDDEGIEVDITDKQISNLLVGQARESVLDYYKRLRGMHE